MQKPSDLFSHLIGHEIEGSIAYVLKERELITELFTSASDTLNLMCQFSITLVLTEKGRNNVE